MLVDMLLTTYVVGAMLCGAALFGMGVLVGHRMGREDPPAKRRGRRRSKRIVRTASENGTLAKDRD